MTGLFLIVVASPLKRVSLLYIQYTFLIVDYVKIVVRIFVENVFTREKDKNSTKSSFCFQTSTQGQKSQK